jgi:RHS repeat-associated protein
LEEEPAGVITATGVMSSTSLITYTYDALNRLTAADYDSGIYFHYTYDSVGNRLSQSACIQTNCTLQTIDYTYDVANRMVSEGVVTYTWDANGNLLDDGNYSYSYNHANQLIEVSNQQTAVNYIYNGLGERISETSNSLTTRYNVDLNAGLSQVLSDGTGIYLYGVERIAQESTSSEQYFLVDALGSVRQLMDANGGVELVKSYRPYGESLTSAGNGASHYGFDGEWASSFTEMMYLRARWYSPAIARFLAEDSWQGDYTRPMSYNAWLYVYGNPINLEDPSGKAPTPPPTPTPIPPIPTPTPYPPGYPQLPTPIPIPVPSRCLPPFNLQPPSRGFMEGKSWSIGVFAEGTIEGKEIVYDFATMERTQFNYTGNIGGIVSSAGVSLYAGQLWGFKWETPKDALNQFNEDYHGIFKGFYSGISTGDIIANVGIGLGYFESYPSKQVKGIFTYVNAGSGLFPGEVVGFETNYQINVNYLDINYVDGHGNVKIGELIGDILSGADAPTGWFGLAYISQNQRMLAVISAINEARKYEAYYEWYYADRN